MIKVKHFPKIKDEEVVFHEFITEHGKMNINVWKEGDLVVINKTFDLTGNIHHLQMTIAEFEELKKIEV